MSDGGESRELRTPTLTLPLSTGRGDKNSTIALEPGIPDGYEPAPDRWPLIPPLPPVSLEAVADVQLPAHNGTEHALDDFYIDLLQFDRDEKAEGVAYKADNFRLMLEFSQLPPPREDYRMLGIVVKSLALLAEKLRDAQIEFTEQRGLAPGDRSFILQDPAGNWLRITQLQPF